MENIVVEPNPNKPMIALSIGEFISRVRTILSQMLSALDLQQKFFFNLFFLDEIRINIQVEFLLYYILFTRLYPE